MRTIIGLTVAVFLVSAPARAQHWHDDHEHWQKYDKHLDDERDHEFDRHLQGCFLQPGDIHIISAYYAPHYRELPSGQRKKFYRSAHLPKGWEKKMDPLPVDVEHELTPIPREYRRGLIDGSIVLYEPKSGAVLDAVVLFSPR